MKSSNKSRPKARQSNQVCILVLGMHRSGTSALTRVLNLLGCALPGELLGGNYSNPEGHWESLRAIEINDNLLASLGRRWDDIRELPEGWLSRPETDIARQQIRAFVDREFTSHKLSVLKEPRLCHLAPLWIEVLKEAGIDARVVIPVRHPAEVAFSLARRDGIAVGRSLLMWVQHLLDAEAASRGQRRALVHFHEFLADWRAQVERLASELGIKWPELTEDTAKEIDAFLRPSLRHADARAEKNNGSRIELPAIVAKLYDSLGESGDAGAWQAIERASAKMAEASALYSPGVAELAQRLERSEQEALSANKLLTTSIADRERRQQTADRIATRVEENTPLLQELIKQIDAQRQELRPAVNEQLHQIVAWRSETQAVLDRPDKLASAVNELLREVEGQRFDVVPTLEQQRKSIEQLRDDNGQQFERIRDEMEQAFAALKEVDPLVTELVRQIDAQREAFGPAMALQAGQIQRINKELAERDKEIHELRSVSRDTVTQLVRATDSLLVHEGQVAKLTAELFKGGQLTQELGQALAAREQDVASLSLALEIAQVKNEGLESASIDALSHIGHLDYLISERDGLIATLRLAATDYAGKLDQLGYQLHEREAHAAALRHQLTSLSRANAESEARIRGLLASRSWRLTRPLRALSSLLRGGTTEPAEISSPTFEAAWYLAQYPDVAASGMDPLEHYELAGRGEGRLPLPPPPAPRGAGRSPFGVLRDGFRRLGVGSQPEDAPTPVPLIESTPKLLADPDFDADFYLLQYPDIAKAGIDPHQHFSQHGRAEGRQGTRPKLLLQSGGVDFDPSKETVVLVSHEASRTGAPVLSLNIVHGLQQRYNVVSLLLGSGPLVPAFRQESALLAGPMSLAGSTLRASLIIDQLLDLYPVKFAIVNSIESRVVLEPFARHSVPTVSLVHEFAAYTRPRHAFREAIFWAEKTVFSTPITHENAVAEYPELAGTPFAILPQGRCLLLTEEVDAESQALEEARVLNVLRPGGPRDEQVVILGAGYVQQRKGVDLFIKCAARVLKSKVGKDCRFVWIGKGYDPDNDMGYSVYLADQLRRSGLERKVIIMNETSNIAAAYDASDILLVSSRLDPLPNVAIDAMAHGLPVVCFEKTTGIAIFLTDAGLAEHCVSPYLDTADMASKVISLASSKSLRKDVGKCVKQLVSEKFDMDRYVGRLEQLAMDACDRVSGVGRDVEEIVGSGLVRTDYFVAPDSEAQELDDLLAFTYLRSWATGVGRRKLFPGFHPGIYAEQHGTTSTLADPLADYLREGRPMGPWCCPVIRSTDAVRAIPATTRVALHLHVYYPDMLPDLLRRIELNAVRPDLFVSVPNSKVAEATEAVLALYSGVVVDVQVVPNRGRDIGPFLTAFGPELVDDYDIVGHLHTKRSLDLGEEESGRRWNEFLLENLLGGSSMMADIILGEMAADPTIGIVFPDDPHVVGWGGNLEFAQELGGKLGLDNFPEHFLFPVGTMFWARMDAIRPLFDLRLDWQDYPPEPLPYDGSVLHALERLLPFVANRQRTRTVVTNVCAVTR